MLKKSMTGDILNISASVVISEFSCKGLIFKQKYRVANTFGFRVLLLFYLYQVIK